METSALAPLLGQCYESRQNDMSKAASIAGVGVAFALGMTLMWALDRGGEGNAATPEASASAVEVVEGARQVNPGAVPVELYVMSQCPYGVQAEEAFKTVVADLGADIDFKVEFIGREENGELSSLHGPPEVMGNIAQACAMKYSPKWFEFIHCQNESYKAVAVNWESCLKTVGLPVEKVTACINGEEGKSLVKASFAKANAADVQGSPTIHIAGKDYGGDRSPKGLMRAICDAYAGAKPGACAALPPLMPVNVTILSDKRCGEDCDSKPIEAQLGRVFAKPNITVVDYKDEAGQKIWNAIKPTELPVLVFDETLADDGDGMAKVAKGIKQVGGYQFLSIGEWAPQCNDDGGCKLDECKDKMMCKTEEPNKLEVFVMSQCPYGVKGLDAMKPVLENFNAARKKAGGKGPELTFQVHFIGEGEEANLSSMHGQPEVDEDIREACAADLYGKDLKFMEYVWCRNKDIQSSSWEGCAAKEKGFDVEKMKKCFEGGEGKKLLAKSFAYSQRLGFGASPTWLVNGKFQFAGIDAETIKKNVCAHNKLPGCENDLSSATPVAQPGAAEPGCE